MGWDGTGLDGRGYGFLTQIPGSAPAARHVGTRRLTTAWFDCSTEAKLISLIALFE